MLPPPSGSDLDAALARLGFAHFRAGQKEAIETLLRVGRALLVAPTGGGKSLTFQLPATLLPGTSLVISPLIALMQDQVEALERRGIPATFLASTLTEDESWARLRALRHGDYKLLYVAPERLTSPWFRQQLASLDCPLVAIDEAHCISEWGHDFRPDYLQIRASLEALPQARVLACTATATPIVRDEILARLGLGADTPQLVHGFARPNLVLRAREVQSATARRRQVDAQLEEALGSPAAARGAGLIYAPTRRGAEAEAERLAAAGWASSCYHAGLIPEQRNRAQQGFISGELELIVATNAFGMGIDRADVRTVIHLAPPGSLEAYYQEVGRAGRDGEPAWGLMLSANQDLPLRRRLIEMPNERGQAPDAAVVEHKWNLFLELMRWAEGGSCRHDAILRYFGAEADLLQGCGRCDVCLAIERNEREPEEIQTIVRKALSGIARVHRRFGLGVAVKLLHGQQDARLERAGLEAVPTFGVLEEFSPTWITSLLRRCITAGWITFSGGDRPMAVLTREGSEVMYGHQGARILLPPEAERVINKSPRRRPESAAGGARSTPVDDELSASDRALFEGLRALRLELAQAKTVPPYVVASDRTLRQLARDRPSNAGQLLLVHGIGPAKARQYGRHFLRVIEEQASTV